MDSAKYLIIEPDKELNFRRPFTTVTKQTLTVINAHPDSPIAFKVKTTAPKQYCVRPNAGRLLPGDRCEVQVLLQAMREDPPPSFKCRDKFLVLALRIPHDVMALDADQAAPRLQELWAHADQIKASAPDAAAELLVERKLRCAFLPAAGAADLPSTGAPPAAAQHLPPLPAAAAAQLPQTPQQHAERLSTAHSEFHDAGDSPSTPAGAARDNLVFATPMPIPPTPAAAPAAAALAALQERERELAEARDKIRSLQSACEAYKIEIERINQVRLRRAEASGHSLPGAADSPARPSPISPAGSPSAVLTTQRMRKDEGISLATLIIAILVAFLAGYYMF